MLTSISLLVALVIKAFIKWELKVTKNPPVVSDDCVKYEEAEVHRSAIMQDFQNNEKENKNGQLAAISELLVRNLSWVILVCDITFCFIFMVQLFCIF